MSKPPRSLKPLAYGCILMILFLMTCVIAHFLGFDNPIARFFLGPPLS